MIRKQERPQIMRIAVGDNNKIIYYQHCLLDYHYFFVYSDERFLFLHHVLVSYQQRSNNLTHLIYTVGECILNEIYFIIYNYEWMSYAYPWLVKYQYVSFARRLYSSVM